jgi:hypothetical protein
MTSLGFSCIQCGRWLYHANLGKWSYNEEREKWSYIYDISKMPKTVQCKECSSCSQIDVIQRDDKKILQVRRIEK